MAGLKSKTEPGEKKSVCLFQADGPGVRGGKSVGLGAATEYSVASSVVTSVLGRRSDQPNMRILGNVCAVVVMG